MVKVNIALLSSHEMMEFNRVFSLIHCDSQFFHSRAHVWILCSDCLWTSLSQVSLVETILNSSSNCASLLFFLCFRLEPSFLFSSDSISRCHHSFDTEHHHTLSFPQDIRHGLSPLWDLHSLTLRQLLPAQLHQQRKTSTNTNVNNTVFFTQFDRKNMSVALVTVALLSFFFRSSKRRIDE